MTWLMTEQQAEAALAIPAYGVKRLELAQVKARVKVVVQLALASGWIKISDSPPAPKCLRKKRKKLGY